VGTTFALLLAAGSGNRLGRPAKAFLELGGLPMFLHSFRSIAGFGGVAGVVILVPDGFIDEARRGIASVDPAIPATVLVGGDTRQESVRCGLAALPPEVDAVLCHDAARPFASASLFERVTRRLAVGGGASADRAEGVVPVVPSLDTVKRVRDHVVVETLPREELGLVQTPQAFRRDALEDAHARAGRSGLVATDDAMLLEAAGYRVAAVEGEVVNFKITTAEDLRRAEYVLAGEEIR
jgi:2-C-methyl-D-erythritol 4-phosphate cytidylyltransferase